MVNGTNDSAQLSHTIIQVLLVLISQHLQTLTDSTIARITYARIDSPTMTHKYATRERG